MIQSSQPSELSYPTESGRNFEYQSSIAPSSRRFGGAQDSSVGYSARQNEDIEIIKAINNSSIKGISKDLNINPDMLAKFLENNPLLKNQTAKGSIK